MFIIDMFNKKTKMPNAAEALPGRVTPIPTAELHFVNGRPLKGPWPDNLQTAMFGMGCFWGVERLFWQVPGVYVTAVGYAGGITPNPTYQETCTGLTGHNEVVLVVFDPAVISYGELLTLFWEEHDPTQGMRQGNDIGTTYRSGIYTFTPEQKAAAEAGSRGLPARTDRCGTWQDHDGNSRGAGILLCRGLSSAVPGKESGRLLWPARHRCFMSHTTGRSDTQNDLTG